MKSYYLIIIFLLFILQISCQKSDTNPKLPEDPREQFLGTWKGTDSFTETNGTIVTQNYTFSISLDSNSDDFIVLDRFANISPTNSQALVASNSFIIANTAAIVNNVQIIFEADGDIINQKMTYRYSMNGTGISREYSGTAVR